MELIGNFNRLFERINSNRGTFIVAGAFFAFFFFLVAAFGVDLSRYFLKVEKTQEIADAAALAGANWFNQVRKIDEVDTGKVRTMALKRIVESRGYSEDAYDIDREMKKGDIQFNKFSPDAAHPDTYFRIGVNVKQVFEPYFLPEQLFGQRYFLVQAQAVAEVDPHFSQNYYPNRGERIPYFPLQYGIHSRKNIKPENMDCFVVNGDLHADSGSIVLEGINGNGCGPGVEITGNLEAGDPDNMATTCGGPSPPPGCIRLENLNGSIDGEAIWATGYTSDGSVVPSKGDVQAAPPKSTLRVPPTPSDEPDQYNAPICTFDAGGGVYTINDFSTLGPCSDGGTLHVKNGGLTIQGENLTNDYTIVADQQVKFSDVSNLDSHDMFVYSVNSNVKFENIDSAEINASIYAPDPEQGQVKWETSSDVEINGGLVAGYEAKIEANGYFKVNYKDNADLMPTDLTTREVRNDIPDYYSIKLIK